MLMTKFIHCRILNPVLISKTSRVCVSNRAKCIYTNATYHRRGSLQICFAASDAGRVSDMSIPVNHITFQQDYKHFSSETLKHYYSPEFPPVGYAQKFLEIMHETTGLPWWASILLATVTVRTVLTLPITVYSQWNMVKLVNLSPELKEKSEQLRAEVASAIKHYNWDGKTAHYWYRKNMRRITQELYTRDNCHPLKTTLAFWFQIPIWIGMSLSLRNMSGTSPFKSVAFLSAVHPELSHEGTLWFTNFIIPDPYFILPVVCGLTNLLNTELAALGRTNPTRFQNIVMNFYRCVGLIVVPLGAILPSCMIYYWTVSSLYGLVTTLLMKHPSVKQVLRMPALPQESKTPYSDLWGRAKNKYGGPLRRLLRRSNDKS